MIICKYQILHCLLYEYNFGIRLWWMIMAMEGLELKSAIEDSLKRILESGAKSTVMVNPEGFVLMSIGNYDEVDEAVATFFVAAVPRSLRALNELSYNIFNNLLRKKILFREKIIDQLQFQIEGRNYIGIYVEGYAIVANLPEDGDVEKTRVALVRAVASIIGLLRRLKASIATPHHISVEAVEEVVVQEEAAKIKVDHLASLEREMAEPYIAYQIVRKNALELRKAIREIGKWSEILNGFEELKNVLLLLVKVHKGLADNSIMQAIIRWVIKTENKIKRILESGGKDIIDKEKMEVLDRGLVQLINHIKRILIGS